MSAVLHDGEELQLERTGDFGERNADTLIFVNGPERPECVVENINLDRPPGGHW